MRFLKLQQVMDKTTLCRSSIYILIKAGDFPKNVTVMGKRKAWLESEVDDWMMAKSRSQNFKFTIKPAPKKLY